MHDVPPRRPSLCATSSTHTHTHTTPLPQCYIGAVRLETYEVGRRLLALGVVSAGDMTTEA
eukprot:scaffold4803_cov104-Isochrysis_galbana.AAC.1